MRQMAVIVTSGDVTRQLGFVDGTELAWMKDGYILYQGRIQDFSQRGGGGHLRSTSKKKKKGGGGSRRGSNFGPNIKKPT